MKWFQIVSLAVLVSFGSVVLAQQEKSAATSSAQPTSKPITAGVLLTDLTPVAKEWGTEKHADLPDLKYGPGICDWMSAGNQGGIWPKEIKIVTSLPPKEFAFPKDTKYSSGMTDYFAVGGDFMTGVGLWARRTTFYHWVDYSIPADAKTFTAKLYVTDDPRGFQWWGDANQQFTFDVLVDDKRLDRVEETRLKLDNGSGKLLKQLRIALPEGSKTIRFRLINSPWGDGNANTELLINEGKFEPGPQ